ncbi:MAG: fibronectin type III domain-containing protein [Bacteroidales bacterium]|nr:fibronectin type III domain-containing protein [Bacteroidales bacterium]
MKKVLFSAMALTLGLLALVSCNKQKSSKEAVFTADIEQLAGQQGRTAMNPENGMVKWLAGDKIVIANDEGETATFTLQSGAGTTNGTFRTTGEFEMTEPFTAVYPQTATISGTTATFSLPATQTLTQTGTFANGANPMAAYAEDENLQFKNLCGGLDVRLLGDNVHISGIRITGSESEKLNGTFAVDCSASEPALMANQGTNGTNIVTLNCDVTLTSTTTAQEFFIMLPVGALANGFTMEVLDGTEVICTKQLETNLAQIVRNEVKRFNPLLIGETPTPIELPDVVTNEVTGITTTTATAGGEIISDGGSTITECGVCWSTEGEPTLEGDHATATATTGVFTVSLTELTQNTTYYIRAYATNEAGTGYGDVLTFTTEEEIVITAPTVTTNEVTDITTTTAMAGGQITSAGNGTISESGICYKTGNEDWTCIALTATNNAFSTTLEGLTPNTTYTVRAYATNEEGTGYGEEVSFTTLEDVPTIPEGAINGLFTINANGDQVYFSQGNLQYIGSAATPYWKFADHQWEYLGDNGQGSSSETVDRDLFGWGTSGYNHGANAYQPWSTSENYSDYFAYGQSNYNLYDGNGQADWGYNAISNGNNVENNGWRTLTQPEWDYVFNTRSTASGIRWAKGMVNGVNGTILLPDNWTASIYALNDTNDSSYNGGSYSSNTISADDWANVLEANGAIFLPAAGNRHGTSVYEVGDCGYYWSDSYNGSLFAYSVYFYSINLLTNYHYFRSFGWSVRLVRNIQ